MRAVLIATRRALLKAIDIMRGAPGFKEWPWRRGAVRRSVVDQQLSVVVWKARDPDQPSPPTKRAVAQIHGHEPAAEPKAEARAYLTGHVLQEIGMLSMQEALLVERSAQAAGRAKAIVDAFIADAVTRMGDQS